MSPANRRELRLFGIGYGLPLAVMLIGGTVQGAGGAYPRWKLMLGLENHWCAYGGCYVLPLFTWLIVRILAAMYSFWRMLRGTL